MVHPWRGARSRRIRGSVGDVSGDRLGRLGRCHRVGSLAGAIFSRCLRGPHPRVEIGRFQVYIRDTESSIPGARKRARLWRWKYNLVAIHSASLGGRGTCRVADRTVAYILRTDGIRRFTVDYCVDASTATGRAGIQFSAPRPGNASETSTLVKSTLPLLAASKL